MERAGLPEPVVAAAEPGIYESDANGSLTKVRPYNLEYRRQIEGDITKASVDYIGRHAKGKTPFLLYIGFTPTHHPSLAGPEFTGKSRIGPYGDAIMELDYRTGTCWTLCLHHQIPARISNGHRDRCLMHFHPNILGVIHEGAPWCRR
jgi:hypothetical protein